MARGTSSDGLGISSDYLSTNTRDGSFESGFTCTVTSCIEAYKRQSRLQETKNPCDAIWPACFILELCKDIMRIILVRGCKKNNADYHDGQHGPIH